MKKTNNKIYIEGNNNILNFNINTQGNKTTANTIKIIFITVIITVSVLALLTVLLFNPTLFAKIIRLIFSIIIRII